MKVISLVNQKGGVAKTTTSMALADFLARHGRKTLLIDFDPQGSLTTSFALADDTDNPQALKLLGLEKDIENVGVEPVKYNSNLDIVTSDMGLEKANTLLAARLVGRERYLRRAIDALNKAHKYDYVVIDSNPSFSQLTINVLYASNHVLVPFKPEFNSFKGIKQLFENIEEIKTIQPNLSVLGFVVTMARQTKSTEEAIQEIKGFAEKLGCRLFAPAIRLAVAAADAPSYGKSIYSYAQKSNVTKDYEALCASILNALENA